MIYFDYNLLSAEAFRNVTKWPWSLWCSQCTWNNSRHLSHSRPINNSHNTHSSVNKHSLLFSYKAYSSSWNRIGCDSKGRLHSEGAHANLFPKPHCPACFLVGQRTAGLHKGRVSRWILAPALGQSTWCHPIYVPVSIPAEPTKPPSSLLNITVGQMIPRWSRLAANYNGVVNMRKYEPWEGLMKCTETAPHVPIKLVAIWPSNDGR